jgi:hypothetical protein
MTNNGLRITLRMVDVITHLHIALLNYVDCSAAERGTVIALALRGHGGDRYGRVAIRSLLLEEVARDLRCDAFPSTLLCTSRTMYAPKVRPRAFHDDRLERFDRLWARSHQRVYGSNGEVVSSSE